MALMALMMLSFRAASITPFSGRIESSDFQNDPRHPAVYTTKPEQHRNTYHPVAFGMNQRQILEQIIGPYKEDIVDLLVLDCFSKIAKADQPARFLQKVYPPFPIGDKAIILNSYKRSSSYKSPRPLDALICEVYACALTYWNCSERLSGRPCPDILFARSLAESALRDDFCSLRLLTVYTSLLNLSSRPVTSVLDNSMDLGRTVALPHSLGLNRDPSAWRMPQAQKNFRKRLWVSAKESPKFKWHVLTATHSGDSSFMMRRKSEQ